MNIRRKAQRNIEKEFLRFKRKMIYRYTKEDIWEACNKIHFYVSLKEYFDLNERIPIIYLELAYAEPALIETAWNVFLKEERLGYRTWPEITELLEEVLFRWRLSEAG